MFPARWRIGPPKFFFSPVNGVLVLTALAVVVLVVSVRLDFFHGLEGWLRRGSLRSWLPALAVVVPAFLTSLLVYVGFHCRAMRRAALQAGILAEELRRNEQQYRAVVENAHAGICIADADDMFVYVNPGFARMFGEEPTGLIGRSLSEFCDAKEFAKVQAMADDRRRGVIGRYEMMVHTRSGDVSRVEVLASPLTSADGGFMGTMAILEEVSTEAEARNALRKVEELNRLLADQASDGIVVVDPIGRIINVNRATCHFTGYSREQLIGKSVYDFVTPQSLKEKQSLLRGAFSGDALVVERRVNTADGRELIVEASISRLDDGNVLIVARDVTERHHTAVSLHRAKEDAEAANCAKTEFLANMSHEIRTPLNGIIGPAQMLLESEDPSDHKAYAEIIVSAGRALMQIVDDILDFSKIEAGRIELDPAPFDLKALVREIISVVGEGARSRGVATNLRVDAGTPLRVVGDAMRIRQILTNLVGNAVKFTTEGSVSIALLCHEMTETTGRFRVTVEDTGPGVSAEMLDSIFDKFCQGDLSSTRMFGGTGLGLAITRQLAELMGGEVGVHSRLGQGSIFWVELPLGIAVEAPQLEIVAGAGGKESSVTGEGHLPRRILLVEDNEDNKIVVEQMLHTIGINRIDHAANGKIALEMLDRVSYDVVLMDCMMPVMDGFEATRLLRTREGASWHTPVIALTACALTKEKQLCLDVGMDLYIAKPVTPQVLRSALNRAGRLIAGVK